MPDEVKLAKVLVVDDEIGIVRGTGATIAKAQRAFELATHAKSAAKSEQGNCYRVTGTLDERAG